MTVKRRGYQSDLSRQSPILLDAEYKGPKINKMLAVLKDAGVISKSKPALALDIGCSRGLFTTAFAPYFDEIVGIDIDTYALPMAREENRQANVRYAYADSLKLPFLDGSIDLVVCNHVYEHTPRRLELLAHNPGGLPVALKNNKSLYLVIPTLLFFAFVNCVRFGARSKIIHANWAINGVIAGLAGKLLRTPVVTTLRGEDVTRAKKPGLDRCLLRSCLFLSTRVVVVS